MKAKNSYEQILEKAERYCAMQEHCAADVVKKMYDWQADKDWQDRIITHLKERDFINDERYAKAYVRSKFNGKGKGRNRIMMELKMKKIDMSIIEEAMAQIETPDYEEKLMKLLMQKWRQLEKYTFIEKKSKLFQSLMQKGYEYDKITVVFEQAKKEDKL